MFSSLKLLPAATARSIVRPRRTRARARSRSGMSSFSNLLTGGYGAVVRSAPASENESEVALGDVFILEAPSGGGYGAVVRSAPASENESEVALGDVFILESPYRRLRRGRSLGPGERERERGRARGCLHPRNPLRRRLRRGRSLGSGERERERRLGVRGKKARPIPRARKKPAEGHRRLLGSTPAKAPDPESFSRRNEAQDESPLSASFSLEYTSHPRFVRASTK